MFKFSMRALISLLLISFLGSSVPAYATPTRPVDIWGDGAADVSRIAGQNRYGTSEEVAKQWGRDVDVAYVVSGENYPDALSAGARAGADGAPIVLVHPDRVPTETVRALQHLRPGKIVLVGGSAAVSSTVKRDLRAYSRSGNVERIAGTNRYRTNAMLFGEQPRGAKQVYLASGENFPDALSAAALAGHEGVPLLLTKSTGLDSSVAARLDALDAQRLVVIGNERAVSTTVAREAAAYTDRAQFSRVEGSNRYETSALVANRFGDGVDTAYVASGRSYPDALAGTALGARSGGPVLLSTESTVSEWTADSLELLAPQSIRVLGGSSVISDTAMGELSGTAAGTDPTCSDPLPNHTVFGASLNQVELSVVESVQDADSTFGRLQVVRHFSPTLPPAWDSRVMRSLADRTLITSFKAPPSQILAGQHDAQLANWFASAPSNQTIYWSYFHEPEPEIKNGEFTAAQYRAAWRRISGIAQEACRPNMHSTLILMGWSANPQSGRNPADYDAGKEHVEVMAFDAYSSINDPNLDHYFSPSKMYDHILNYMKDDGRPFGLAETGTRLVPGDDGSVRAEWLADIGDYMIKNDAIFVSYFNSVNDAHWRLSDPASQRAWAQLVQNGPHRRV